MVARINHQIIDDMECKWCGKCRVFKPLERFGVSKQTWDKFRPTCKDCLHEHNMNTKEQRTEYNKKYWEETKEAQSEKSKKWRENNKDRVKENMKRWLEENKEYKKQKDAEYRKRNWEHRKQMNAKWQRENYAKMKSDPSRMEELANHKIKYNTSRRIREILGQQKSDKCMDYVACSLVKFRILLETKFEDGMTWKNYGENPDGGKTRAWHIDHIIPCNAFDMKNPIHRKACFHYTNMQPLWWDANIRKKDTFDVKVRDNYIKWYIECHIQK
jgi:hypothetical protein